LIEKFGQVRATSLPGWVDSDATSAMVTLILKASERATKELNQGQFIRAIIENAKGKLLFSEIEGKIIVIIATTDAKLGIINLKLDAARKILQELGG
ncbi:MAG: roadblock/LC7 domain-containing protein, partial [Promethearchaeota archaeon]